VTVLALAVSGRGLVDPDQPVVHADDEAFMRGRAAFETVRVYSGIPFRLGEHLDRLAVSAQRVGLPALDRSGIEVLVTQALEQAATPEAVLRIYATPGRSGNGSGSPLTLALVAELPADVEQLRARGLRAITVEFRPASLIGGVKSTSYALNMMAVDEAKARGSDDAVFVGEGGVVLEATTSNVWWCRGRKLFTPARELGILAGVTREFLLELAPAQDYEVVQGAFNAAEPAAADEAFTSSSVREVMPVVALDGRTIGGGAPGPASSALQAALREAACR
jgi:branched-subunit amino acid aminotransferase/4-amino-4-deoxychorismate lyase